MPSSPAASRLNRRYLFFVAGFAVVLYILIPQLHAFQSSWHLLLHPDITWVLVAIVLTALSYMAAAATYCLLAFTPLRYGATLVVQLAAMFVNRLLPGGLGALGVNYAYLHRMKHSPAQAGSVVALNNLAGVAGHGLLVGAALALTAGHTPLPAHNKTWGLLIKIVGICLVLVVAGGLFFRRGRLNKLLGEIWRNILSYRERPWRLLAALMSSMVLTLSNVLCLAGCALALGVHLPFAALLIIFTFGISTSTAVPTPGGLGGFEAGLTGGMVAYHVGSSPALAVALLYRLVSYWLPLLAGAPAFVVCQRRRLLRL